MHISWAANSSRAVETGRRLSQATVLVVDDTEAMRKITANQLRQMGVQKLLLAGDGMDALRLIQANSVDLVVSDWQMPQMDGLALLAKVRATPRGAAIPFVLMTAETPRDQILESVRMGVSELLVKPFTAGLFMERIERALYWRPSSTKVALPDGSLPELGAVNDRVSRQMLTILVVDDAPDNLSLLSELFRDRYRVKVANAGSKAIAICQSEDPPDLVLLDVMMPAMDGYEVAHRLREHPTSEHIPVIFVTSLADDGARLRGMALGAVDYVTKPIQPETLRVRVANFMRFVEMRRNLQADYDQLLKAQKQRDAVQEEQNRGMRGPLLRALAALEEVSGGGVTAARQQIESALVDLDARARCRALEQGCYQPVCDSVKPIGVLRDAVECMRSELPGIEWVIQLAPGLDEDDSFEADRALLLSSLRVLMRLAAEVAVDGSAVQVSLWMRHTARFQIQLQGLVPEEARERLFDDFVTEVYGANLRPRVLVQALKGTLALEQDTKKEQSWFVMTLPTEVISEST